MRIGVVGVNHKLADLVLREHLAKICQHRFGSQRVVHFEHAFVLLSTCNRTEIYFSSKNLAATHTYILNILRNEIDKDFDQKLYSYFNEDCFLHLARVACGLDSALIFETEIQGQVKIAYETSSTQMHLPKDLHFLFQKCLRIGKKVRSSMPTIQSKLDLEHAIYTAGYPLMKSVTNPKILFVGCSNINLKILHFLKKKNLNDLTLCNRTESTAQIIANKYGLKTLDWNSLNAWITYDWVIVGTKSPEYLVSFQQNISSTPKLVIDLSVPRNVNPNVSRSSAIKLLNIDQLNQMLSIRKKRLSNFIKSSEQLISESAMRHICLFRKKNTYATSQSSFRYHLDFVHSTKS